MYRSRLVDTLVTHANIKGVGLTPLSENRRGYMPPLLKTKTKHDLDFKAQPSYFGYPRSEQETYLYHELDFLEVSLCENEFPVLFSSFPTPSDRRKSILHKICAFKAELLKLFFDIFFQQKQKSN